jgi:hypothetical protein
MEPNAPVAPLRAGSAWHRALSFVTRQPTGGARSEVERGEASRGCSNGRAIRRRVQRRLARGKRAGLIPEGPRAGGLTFVARVGRSVGRTGHLLCRPSPPPPYRACRSNFRRCGSRGKPLAGNDVAHIKSAADVELVLSGEVGHIDRVIAAADVVRIEDAAGGAAQSCGARRLTFAREGALTRREAESIDRYHGRCRAVISGRSDAGNGNGFSSTVLAADSDVSIDTGGFEDGSVAARAAGEDSLFCAINETDP